MKCRLALLIVLLLVWAHNPVPVSANGADLSFPAAKTYGWSTGYSSDHPAYDYLFSNYTQVAAAKAGTVAGSKWSVSDGAHNCDGTINNWGNYIILSHDNGAETRYEHLSNTGAQPGAGASFFRGQYMALSDDKGCSSGSHLHFELRINGSNVDPYAGSTQWVSGTPIAMGYTVGPTTYGPFKIVFGVEAKWVSIQGAAGSPMNEEHCPSNSPGLPWSDDGVVQDFTANTSRILWSGPTGTHWIYGAISAKFVEVGGPWPNPAPGYPTTDEFQWDTYRRTNFDRGYITWRADQGAVWYYNISTSRNLCHW